MVRRYEMIVDDIGHSSYVGMILDNIEDEMKAFDAVYNAGQQSASFL